MESIIEILKISIPAALVLYGIYLTVKSFLNKEFESKMVQAKLNNQKEILPLRLQAYERIIILLERISLRNLVLRTNHQELNVAQLHHLLNEQIRAEFAHNISQQIYMSDEAWSMTKQAVEEVISTINTALEGLNPEAPSIELAKKIFDKLLTSENDFCEIAQKFIKNEVRGLF
ncbi:MAG: hypothetical protein OHK0038_09360 [Flammeovirgaceae bacterium]